MSRSSASAVWGHLEPTLLLGGGWGLGLCALCAALLYPLPNLALDLGIACSWALGVGFFTLALNAPALSLPQLPQWLLLMAVGRLGLNIATTRAILSEARAGEVVSALGERVMGGSWLVGVSFFITLTVIQLIVISRGAERIAEVSARFALDALPSAQQALTHALDRDAIHPEDARRARLVLRARAELCGALDGSMRFVKGEAVASMILALVNVVGGVLIGVSQPGGELSRAWGVYVPLMIGDGLVAQLPALLSTLAVATVVSRLPQAYSASVEGVEVRSAARQRLLALSASSAALLTLSLSPGWSAPVRCAWLGLCVVGVVLSRHRSVYERQKVGEVEPFTLQAHPAALSAIGGEERLLSGLSKGAALLGLPQRPIRLMVSRGVLPEGGYLLSRGGKHLAEGVVIEGCFASFVSPPPPGVPRVRHPLWGLEGWWRPEEGGWSADSEPSALSQLDLICAHCVAAWISERAESWTLDEVWARLSEAPASLRSAALKPWLEPMTLTALFRRLSASGVDLRSSRACLEGVALCALEGERGGGQVSIERLESETRLALGWERLSWASRRLSLGLSGAELSGALTVSLEAPLSYVLIDLDCQAPWEEEHWDAVYHAMRVACAVSADWVVLCEPERRGQLEARLRARARGVAVVSWAELPAELSLEQVAWVST